MTNPQPTTIDCIFENILGFMLPFFFSSAGGDADCARAAIHELARAYNAATATELEIVGRLLGFSVVAMDNLRLSMKPDLSDTKVLRYRSNAVALSRAAEQCRKVLEVMKDNRKPEVKPLSMPAPVKAAASPPVPEVRPAQAVDTRPRPQPVAASSRIGGLSRLPDGSEAAKQEARMLLDVFAKNRGSVPFLIAPDPAAVVDKAVRQAFNEVRRTAGL